MSLSENKEVFDNSKTEKRKGGKKMLIRFLKRILGISELEWKRECLARGNAILIEIVAKYIPAHIVDFKDYDRLNTARRLSDGIVGAGQIPVSPKGANVEEIKKMWVHQLKA